MRSLRRCTRRAQRMGATARMIRAVAMSWTYAVSAHFSMAQPASLSAEHWLFLCAPLSRKLADACLRLFVLACCRCGDAGAGDEPRAAAAAGGDQLGHDRSEAGVLPVQVQRTPSTNASLSLPSAFIRPLSFCLVPSLLPLLFLLLPVRCGFFGRRFSACFVPALRRWTTPRPSSWPRASSPASTSRTTSSKRPCMGCRKMEIWHRTENGNKQRMAMFVGLFNFLVTYYLTLKTWIKGLLFFL